MGNRRIITIAAIMMAICETGLSLESPVGRGTAPPTAYRSGLTASPNPIDASGNLVVTGNVSGQSYFHGIVPYGGVTDFSAAPGTLSSTSGAFDSFLRRSSGSQVYERSDTGLTPYYSPTMSVTRIVPGTRGGVYAPQASVGYRDETYYGPTLPGAQTGYNRQVYAPMTTNRPLSMNQIEMEKVIEQDVRRIPLGGEPVTESQTLEQFWREMGIEARLRPKAVEQKKGSEPAELVKGTLPDIKTLLESQRESEKKLAELEKAAAQKTAKGEEPDVFEQMKRQLAEPVKVPEVLKEGIEVIPKAETGQAHQPVTGQVEPNKPQTGAVSIGTSAIARAGAAEVYKSFASLREDKFNKHIRVAEEYMKEGRFYRAADAYTLATAYKPGDPLGYAGKSIALFATGEYMSSSLFLARALEIFPEYAKIRVDLVGIIGDKDLVENSILDAREWTTRSDSGELEFLLSYIYYQMDRMEFAKRMIDEAAKKMPDSKAVAAMKRAIEERAAGQ